MNKALFPFVFTYTPKTDGYNWWRSVKHILQTKNRRTSTSFRLELQSDGANRHFNRVAKYKPDYNQLGGLELQPIDNKSGTSTSDQELQLGDELWHYNQPFSSETTKQRAVRGVIPCDTNPLESLQVSKKTGSCSHSISTQLFRTTTQGITSGN